MILASLLLVLAQGSADADVLWSSGERVAAIERMTEELASRPDDTALRIALIRREIAIHRYAAALENASPLGSEIAPERGYCLYRLGRFEEALEDLDPTDPAQSLYVFDTLEILGRADALQGALASLRAARGDDDAEVLVRRGRLAATAGEHEDATTHFRAALARDAVHAEAWFGLGQSLVRLGRREEAMDALERHRALAPLLDALEFAQRSLDLSPNHAPNHANVGDVERALGRLDAAESAYRRAAILAHDGDVTPIALRHARLLAEDKKDLEGALVVLSAANDRVPDVRLLVRKGDLLLAADRAEDALRELSMANAIRPGDPEIERRLAAAKAALGTDG